VKLQHEQKYHHIWICITETSTLDGFKSLVETTKVGFDFLYFWVDGFFFLGITFYEGDVEEDE